MLIVDYIAIATLALVSFLHLLRGWNMGVLYGGWGFEACLLYRAYFSRLQGAMETNASGADAVTEMQGLFIFLIFVFKDKSGRARKSRMQLWLHGVQRSKRQRACHNYV